MKFARILLLLSAAALSFAQVSDVEDGAAGADLAAGADDGVQSEVDAPEAPAPETPEIPATPPADDVAGSNTNLDAVPDVSDANAETPADTAGLTGADAGDNGTAADAGADADNGEASDNDDSADVNALDSAPAADGANGEAADAGANGEEAAAGADADAGEASDADEADPNTTTYAAAGAGIAATAAGAGIFFWTKKTKRQGLDSLRSQAALV